MNLTWLKGHLARIVLALLVALMSAGSAGAQEITDPTAEPAGGDVQFITAAQDGIDTQAAFTWTAEEMRAAKPYPLPTVPGSNRGPAPAALDVAAMTADGPAGALAGSAPARSRGRMADTQLDTTELLLDDAIDPATFPSPGNLAYSYPPPFASFQALSPYTGSSTYRWYPLQVHGKLFFRQGGGSFVCSATVINQSHLLTAGHCVHAGNNSSSGWSTNVVFCPAYRDGACPLGTWTFKPGGLITTIEWYRFGNPAGFRRDVGGVALNRLSGRTIGAVTGWAGLAWNQNAKQTFFAHGYPQASPFNGQRLWNAVAGTNRADTGVPTPPINGPHPAPLGMGSNLTPGSSGGGWMISINSSGPIYVNGVNSYKYNSDKLQMYSPYFDSRVKSLYDSLIRM